MIGWLALIVFAAEADDNDDRGGTTLCSGVLTANIALISEAVFVRARVLDPGFVDQENAGSTAFPGCCSPLLMVTDHCCRLDTC